MFKRFIIAVMISIALTACGHKSPTIYNDRYIAEEVTEFVKETTDLKTNEVKLTTKDGDETDLSNNITWENANVITWDDI